MKIKVNSPHLDASLAGVRHIDGLSPSVFFQRQLEYIVPQIYKKEYPRLMGKMAVPVKSDIPEGAKSIAWRYFDKVGFAQWIVSYADDLPLVNLRGQELNTPVKGFGDAYTYSYDDIRAAMMVQGMNLDTDLAAAAKEAAEQFEDNVIWFGDQDFGIPGFLTNANITRAVAADGAAVSTLWSTKTPLEIIADVRTLVTGIVTTTRGVEYPDTIIMPVGQLAYIQTTPMSADNTNMTIFNFLEKAFPSIEFMGVEKLSGISPAIVGGGDSADVMVAYERNKDKIEYQQVMSFLQHPPQERNLSFVINCEAKSGGVIIRRPLSVSLMEGI